MAVQTLRLNLLVYRMVARQRFIERSTFKFNLQIESTSTYFAAVTTKTDSQADSQA